MTTFRKVSDRERLRAFAFLGLFVACAVTPACADGSVSALGMGSGAKNPTEFERYRTVVKQYNASGERFRIDSHCQSACTMFLAIRNVCVVSGATLGFHAGRNPDATQQMISTYNAALRTYLKANGAMETRTYHVISGRDIISRFGYRACP